MSSVDRQPVAGQRLEVGAIVAPDRYVSPFEPASILALGGFARRQVGSIPIRQGAHRDHAGEKPSQPSTVRIGQPAPRLARGDWTRAASDVDRVSGRKALVHLDPDQLVLV
jgi:hypothetical protein